MSEAKSEEKLVKVHRSGLMLQISTAGENDEVALDKDSELSRSFRDTVTVVVIAPLAQQQ